MRQNIQRPTSLNLEQRAAENARDRARSARWDLDVAVFLFAILIIIIILLFQGIGMEIVSPVAVVGLALVWLVGWRRGRQLYLRFFEEELAKLQPRPEKSLEETIEDRVQQALRERLGK